MIMWAWQIANAMAYLASNKVREMYNPICKNNSHRKASVFQIIHGDLAARNVLLKDQSTVKLTDFGLSKKLYMYSIYNRSDEVSNITFQVYCIVFNMVS